MRTRILLASAALLLASSAANRATGNIRGDMFVAQGMTGSAGSNPATTAVSPRTAPGPHPSHGAEGRAPRTSLDGGTSSPLAGDEKDQQRAGAGTRRDAGSSAPASGSSSPRDGSR